MKKSHPTLLLLAVLLLVNCSEQQHYTIDGSLGELDSPATIYLLEVEDRTSILLDSVVLQKGKFKLKGNTDKLISRLLALDENGTGYQQTLPHISLFLEAGVITVENDDSNLHEAVIKGTPNNDAKLLLDEQVSTPLRRMRAELAQKREQASLEMQENDAFLQELATEEEQIMERYKKLVFDFIYNHPDVMVSLYELGGLADVEDYDKVELLYNNLSDELKQHDLGQQLATRLKTLKSLAIGSPMPEFTLPDTSGNPVSSSDFEGQYLLIDLWAAWCAPCRVENPNLVALYNTYHDKNFNILGVSLDESREDWLAAIQKDGLTWTQVSDLKYWESAAMKHFGISSIPTNYLLDPSGKIIARDLHGQALRNKLEELLAEGT